MLLLENEIIIVEIASRARWDGSLGSRGRGRLSDVDLGIAAAAGVDVDVCFLCAWGFTTRWWGRGRDTSSFESCYFNQPPSFSCVKSPQREVKRRLKK